MRFGMLIFEFADDCTTVPGEVWEGDLSQFRFDEADWVDCETCRGSGECRHCHGRGDVSEIDIDGFTEWVDCRRCEDGVCPNPDCMKGKIRIAE